MPETLIEYLPSLIGSTDPIHFYSCFISYSHKDEEFAKRLHSRMQEQKIRTYYAPEEMKGGEKVHEQLVEAIRLHDKLLLVLSDDSMSSEHAVLEFSGAGVRLRDLGSMNGCRVNGANVQAADLKHGDRIELGSSAFQFLLEQRRRAPRTYVIESD